LAGCSEKTERGWLSGTKAVKCLGKNGCIPDVVKRHIKRRQIGIVGRCEPGRAEGAGE